jgi:hypothetical protein
MLLEYFPVNQLPLALASGDSALQKLGLSQNINKS